MKTKHQFLLFLPALFLSFFIYIGSARAATYHIDPSASTSGNGSAASPFRSWTNLPAMQSGDDVYFKCGTTFTPSAYLNVSWPGTASNRAVIGSYYMNGTTPVYGVSGNRPIISGSNWTVPSRTSYQGLISFNGNRDYVTVENLEIYRSGYFGVHTEGDYTAAGSASYFIIKNVYVNTPWSSGITVNKNPYNYGVIDGCEVYRHEEKVRQIGGNWGHAITVGNSPYAHTTIKNCYVHEGSGEGIGSTRVAGTSDATRSGFVTIEDNICFNNYRVCFYIDLAESCVVRRNLAIGASSATAQAAGMGILQDGRYWNLRGFAMDAEERGTPLPSITHNNAFYNNIAVGFYRGFSLGSYYNYGTMNNNRFYNNTAIANRHNYLIWNSLSTITLSGIEFKNNVSVCPSDAVCADVHANLTWMSSKAGLTLSHNSWEARPSNWAGTGDVVTDNNWTRMTGWQSLTAPVTDPRQFMPLANSSVVSAGANLGSPYDLGIAQSSRYQVSPLNISVSTVDRDSVGWDMGAVPNQ